MAFIDLFSNSYLQATVFRTLCRDASHSAVHLLAIGESGQTSRRRVLVPRDLAAGLLSRQIILRYEDGCLGQVRDNAREAIYA